MDQPLPEPLAGLVREHRIVEDLVTRARKALADATTPNADAGTVAAALEQARDLDAFAAVDLALHIAKEERVLFPAVRARAEAEMETVIVDMLAQHDEIREGEAQIRRLLDALGTDHDELTGSVAELADGLRATHDNPSPSALVALHATVRTLDALLQGHFLDEEDNVFEVVSGWFSPDVLGELGGKMKALEGHYV